MATTARVPFTKKHTLSGPQIAFNLVLSGTPLLLALVFPVFWKSASSPQYLANALGLQDISLELVVFVYLAGVLGLFIADHLTAMSLLKDVRDLTEGDPHFVVVTRRMKELRFKVTARHDVWDIALVVFLVPLLMSTQTAVVSQGAYGCIVQLAWTVLTFANASVSSAHYEQDLHFNYINRPDYVALMLTPLVACVAAPVTIPALAILGFVAYKFHKKDFVILTTAESNVQAKVVAGRSWRRMLSWKI